VYVSNITFEEEILNKKYIFYCLWICDLDLILLYYMLVCYIFRHKLLYSNVTNSRMHERKKGGKFKTSLIVSLSPLR